MTHRRSFISALGAGALAALGAGALHAPRASFAQQPSNPAGAPGKIWRVGLLLETSAQSEQGTRVLRGLQQALRELGYVEGKNLVIEARFADLDAQRLQSHAEALARLPLDVIVAANTTATHAAQKASARLPIVMINSADPVHSGFAKSLAKPGGNITGLSTMSPETGTKLLEMLLEITAATHPKLTRVAVLIDPANSGNVLLLQNLQAAARITRSRLLPLEVRNEADLANAFAAMKRERSEGLILARNGVFAQLARPLAERAAQLRLPSASGNLDFTEAGGLMSYSPLATDSYKRVALYVERIFKGARPGDLPIEQPTRFQLVINGKTAKTLGLKIPQSLLISAERVIE